MRRRQFLTLSATSVGGLLVYTLERRPERVHAQTLDAPQSGAIKVPLRFFTRPQALTIAAACARIFPADDAGPGANEAGVVIYIDRQLASPYGRDQYRYTQPPFLAGVPEQGYQARQTPRQIYRDGLKLLGRFQHLSPGRQDARLKEIEATLFFSLLRSHTIEGMFCDPMHGGNIDLIGWQLIGFPGPRMSYLDEIDQYHGRPFRPKPASLSQILGHPARPIEDDA